ncbi:hypothetical protein [Demequina sp. NBRC 110054]|uniref:hypothetical protein n=1 Tax=Demequina sp. NBRC 110054 TaxID=1570343 RepID=UPI001177B62B|nr:hypothetical protein [Demequina sp. NBRC 110054]
MTVPASWTALPIIPAAPGWWGGNTHVYVERTGEGEVVHRLARAHRARVMPFDASADLVGALASAGLGPELVSSEPGHLVTRCLEPGAIVLNHTRIREHGLIGRVLGMHRAVAALDVAVPVLDPVAEVERLLGVLTDLGTTLPYGGDEAARLVLDSRDALTATEAAVPSLGDAAATNLLLLPDGSLQAVGGTLACAVDPAYTAGALLAEYAPYLGSPEELFMDVWGGWDAAAYRRARLFGLVDDVRWAAISRIAAVLADNPGFVASHTGNLRVKHAVATMHDPELESWRVAA